MFGCGGGSLEWQGQVVANWDLRGPPPGKSVVRRPYLQDHAIAKHLRHGQFGLTVGWQLQEKQQ